MGGASSEIADSTTEVLLEAAYFTPMAIARTSKRLGLRTEASARFERGCDPWGIEPSVQPLLPAAARERARAPGGRRHARRPRRRARALRGLGAGRPGPAPDRRGARTRREIAELIEPDRVRPCSAGSGSGRPGSDGRGADQPARRPPRALRRRRRHRGGRPHVRLLQRAAPHADLAAAGRPHRRSSAHAALVKDVLVRPRRLRGLDRHLRLGRGARGRRADRPGRAGRQPARRREAVPAPLLLPGLLGALAYNAGRRQPDVRLFEVGVVFSHPGEGSPRVFERAGAGGSNGRAPGRARDAVCASSPSRGRRPPGRGRVARPGRRLPPGRRPPGSAGRRAPAAAGAAPDPLRPPRGAPATATPGRRAAGIGAVGEVDPDVAATFGLTRTTGSGTVARRVGWLEVDLGLLFDEALVPAPHRGRRRRQPLPVVGHRPGPGRRRPLSGRRRGRHAPRRRRRPARVGSALRRLPRRRDPEGARSLAYRLRFCSPERTLTDEEVGALRARCIAAVEEEFERRPALTALTRLTRRHGSAPGARPSRPWHGGRVEVRLIDPDDETPWPSSPRRRGLGHQDLWPGLSGYTLPDFRAFARFAGKSRR